MASTAGRSSGAGWSAGRPGSRVAPHRGGDQGFGADTVEAARAAGLADVGENYAQELVAKATTGAGRVRWHFLGPVQRNKVKRLAPLVATWHGIDRPVAVDAVAAASPGVEVLVQVNVTGSAGPAGLPPEEVEALVEHCRSRPLALSGLMAVGAGR